MTSSAAAGVQRLLWPAWNSRERRVRAAWRILITLTVALSLAVGLAHLLLPVFGRSLAAAGGALIAISGTVLLALRFLDRDSIAAVGLEWSGRWASDLVFGLALGAALPIGMLALGSALGFFRLQSGPLLTGSDYAVPILSASAQFVAVGFYEELLVRGYLLRNAAEGLAVGPIGPARAVLAAWILSSILFASGHAANPNSSAATTCALIGAGLFAGLARILTGRLALPIGVHITWNLAESMLGFSVSGSEYSTRIFELHSSGPELWTGGNFGPEAGLLGLLAYGVGCAAILAWTRLREGRLSLSAGIARFSSLPPERRSNRAADHL